MTTDLGEARPRFRRDPDEVTQINPHVTGGMARCSAAACGAPIDLDAMLNAYDNKDDRAERPRSCCSKPYVPEGRALLVLSCLGDGNPLTREEIADEIHIPPSKVQTLLDRLLVRCLIRPATSDRFEIVPKS